MDVMAIPSAALRDGDAKCEERGLREPQEDEHVIPLSAIERSMPRAYIRMCLVYPVKGAAATRTAVHALRRFARRMVDARPYLAGRVVIQPASSRQASLADVLWTTQDYLETSPVVVSYLTDEKDVPLAYDEVDRAGCPPSCLIPERVSCLPANVTSKAQVPVFCIQANVIAGGLVVAIYVHHCICDGTGIDRILSSEYRDGDFVPPTRRPDGSIDSNGLGASLRVFASRMTSMRVNLSLTPASTLNTRGLRGRPLDDPAPRQMCSTRGCIFMLSTRAIQETLQRWQGFQYMSSDASPRHSITTVIMALLWKHMTRARWPSIRHPTRVQTSRLAIPVDVRSRVHPPLPDWYLGAAVDFATVDLAVEDLIASPGLALHELSSSIRRAIDAVDDAYVREMVAFVERSDGLLDAYDVQASNLDRIDGADMYITSWLRQRAYEHELGMNLGPPTWVRKPWSRDAGACVILPLRQKDAPHVEVLVQMTAIDIERLLHDEAFMAFVDRVVD